MSQHKEALQKFIQVGRKVSFTDYLSEQMAMNHPELFIRYAESYRLSQTVNKLQAGKDDE